MSEGDREKGNRLKTINGRSCGTTTMASPRAAAPRSLPAVLCPETLQHPHAPDGRGTATGRRRTRPAGGLPPTVDAWQPSCGDRVCGHLHRHVLRHLRPADAGVCASRCGGGAPDSKTLPEWGNTHTACCVRVWCLIARPLGRGWVCVWRGAGSRGGGGGAGWHALRGEGETSTNTVCPPGLSGMVRVSDVPHWTKSAGTTPPPRMLCLECSACLDE